MSRSLSKRWRLPVAAVSTLSLVAAALVGASMASATDDDRVAPSPPKITKELDQSFDDDATQDFWVLMSAKADTTAGPDIADWTERGAYVAETRRAFAADSQAPVLEALAGSGAEHTSYWVVNAVRVSGGSYALATDLSSISGVEALIPPVGYELVEPVERVPAPDTVDAVEWGVANINADDVWDQYGVRGEGITVANVDTGVDYEHPALVDSYRGNNGDGTFDHNYNWFDAAGNCGDAPCDDDDHGTHTMGTMVGEDGANQIGVAPGANWIATNGCCPSDEALLASMQWILEPTDLNGENPDASRRPHVVNNSWGSGSPSTDPFGEEIQQGWNDSGIFGSWSNGNSGRSCATSGSPGSRIINYSSGAYDINNDIASFSSRGAGQDGEIKPNISAPGVNVRSSVAGGSYDEFSGTSMAAPHTGGAVALLWSAAPAMVGDIEGTRALLNDTAIDTSDLQCGGTADDNNVYGEGRLDALALVDAAPMGDTGTLAGTVTDEATGDPIAGAEITVTGPLERETSTDENGEYSLSASTGTYEVSASSFGYEAETQTAEVAVDDTTTVDFALTAAENWVLIGAVRDRATGEYIARATVQIEGTPLATTTNQRGRYRFESVPSGTYDITAANGACYTAHTKTAVIDGVWPRSPVFNGDERKRFRLAPVTDSFGYSCSEEPADYVEGTEALALTGDEVTVPVALPSAFPYYGTDYQTAHVSTNGYVSLVTASPEFINTPLPDAAPPNATLAAFWDDLVIDTSASVHTGSGPGWFSVEWRNATFYFQDSLRVDVSMTLYDTGEILYTYRNLDPETARERGDSASVGIENQDGTVGLQYSNNAYNPPVLDDATAVRFTPPAA